MSIWIQIDPTTAQFTLVTIMAGLAVWCFLRTTRRRAQGGDPSAGV